MQLQYSGSFKFSFNRRSLFSKSCICFGAGLFQIVQILALVQATFVSTLPTCERNYQLAANQSVLFRSNQGPSCQIAITAPEDYGINISCNISIPRDTNQCTTDNFFVNTDGSRNLTGSTVYCGKGTVEAQSLFRTLVITYTTSRNVSYGSYYSCLAQAKPQPCDCGWSTDTKIVGGTETKINEFPFMAGLVSVQDRFIFCGGSIISHHYVLSAAHCFILYSNAAELAVVVGEHKVSAAESPYTAIHLVKSIEINELYSGNANDIALVATLTSMEWSRGVGPACLPFLYAFAQFTGMEAEIAGWGTTEYAGPRSDVLMKAYTNVISNANCKRFFPKFESSQMCTFAVDSDSCQMDSGGPVILQYDRLFVIGIVSYGLGCALDIPAVNTRVTSYLQWIQNRTGAKFCRKM